MASAKDKLSDFDVNVDDDTAVRALKRSVGRLKGGKVPARAVEHRSRADGRPTLGASQDRLPA
jgi:hypothetical protein